MTTRSFTRETRLPVDRDQLWEWHTRPGAFTRLAPPWQSISLIDPGRGVEDGSRALIQLQKAGVPLRWLAEHRNVQPPTGFDDVQLRGPFRRWTHEHRFLKAPEGSILRDHVRYALPGGALANLLAGRNVDRDLVRTFRYRHDITRDDILLHARFHDRPRLRVAISGSSGLIGSALSALLTTGGHEVISLVRSERANEAAVRWNTTEGLLDLAPLDGIDALVHLAGENIAAGRWTPARMERIRDSRVLGTRALVRSLERLSRPPRTLVCASAIGLYGERGEDFLDETSASGTGFLAEVGREWEEAALSGAIGARRVLARFGVVLSPRGGALAKMLTPFRLGAGGRLGSGHQFMSWISIDDAIAAVLMALLDDSLTGPINVTAPTPVTNREFTATLATVLRRPALLPVPAAAARLTFGRMADEALLASTKALPAKLEATGFGFRHPNLEAALRHLLGRHDE